ARASGCPASLPVALPIFAVADLAGGGAAVDRHAAHLGRGHPQRGVVAFLRDELDGDARRATDLAALAGAQFDVVDRGTDRDVAQDRKSTRLNSSHVKISY